LADGGRKIHWRIQITAFASNIRNASAWFLALLSKLYIR
jgi:hypothetical protein